MLNKVLHYIFSTTAFVYSRRKTENYILKTVNSKTKCLTNFSLVTVTVQFVGFSVLNEQTDP